MSVRVKRMPVFVQAVLLLALSAHALPLVRGDGHDKQPQGGNPPPMRGGPPPMAGGPPPMAGFPGPIPSGGGTSPQQRGGPPSMRGDERGPPPKDNPPMNRNGPPPKRDDDDDDMEKPSCEGAKKPMDGNIWGQMGLGQQPPQMGLGQQPPQMGPWVGQGPANWGLPAAWNYGPPPQMGGNWWPPQMGGWGQFPLEFARAYFGGMPPFPQFGGGFPFPPYGGGFPFPPYGGGPIPGPYPGPGPFPGGPIPFPGSIPYPGGPGPSPGGPGPRNDGPKPKPGPIEPEGKLPGLPALPCPFPKPKPRPPMMPRPQVCLGQAGNMSISRPCMMPGTECSMINQTRCAGVSISLCLPTGCTGMSMMETKICVLKMIKRKMGEGEKKGPQTGKGVMDSAKGLLDDLTDFVDDLVNGDDDEEEDPEMMDYQIYPLVKCFAPSGDFFSFMEDED